MRTWNIYLLIGQSIGSLTRYRFNFATNKSPSPFPSTSSVPVHVSQEYNAKLAKVKNVQKEIRNHLHNLPDLTQLPDVTGGLAPLPSAGDLFNIH